MPRSLAKSLTSSAATPRTLASIHRVTLRSSDRNAGIRSTFPQSKRYAAELTAGTGYDRFDFTIGLMIGGLAQ
jgi:hypothetical protein